MRTRDVMTTEVISVSPDHAVKQAAKIMMDNNISGLPVVDDEGNIVGIISEGDLIRRTELVSEAFSGPEDTACSDDARANAYVKRTSWRVGDAMTADVITIGEDTPLIEVAKLMHDRGIKRIPVMRMGELVGIVSRNDLLQIIVTSNADQTAAGDNAIQRSITHRLKENTGLEDHDLTVTVQDGTVHLWGAVKSIELRQAARVVVEKVSGVRGIVEHFTDS